MRNITVKMLPVLAGLCLAGAASAQEVEFSSLTSAPGYSLATQLYGPEIDGYRGVSVETAVIDLDDDGVGELAVRFQSVGTCGGGACLTVVARYNADSETWEEVFREEVRGLSLAPSAESNLKNIVIGEDDVFAWQNGSYQRSLEESGYTMSWSRSDNPAILNALRRDLSGGSSYETIRFAVDTVDMNNDGEEETFVYVEDMNWCGSAVGCPVYAYTSFDEPPFFRGSGRELVEVTNSMRNGMRQVVLHTSFGMRVNYWNGSQWAVD